MIWEKFGDWVHSVIAVTTVVFVLMNILFWLIGIACVVFWLWQWAFA